MSTDKITPGPADAPSPSPDASARETTEGLTDAASDIKVHLLDIGSGKKHQYGDCLLCQFGDVSVLIDGGHRGDEDLVLGQLEQLLGRTSPVTVALIIVTHPHDDHIGCLPSLVAQGALKADWALVCDPQYRWGAPGDTDNDFAGRDARVRGVVEAALEHDRTVLDDDTLTGFIANVASLETSYRTMLAQLKKAARGSCATRTGRTTRRRRRTRCSPPSPRSGSKFWGLPSSSSASASAS